LERDRGRLSCQDTRRITGSLNLDAAAKSLYPDQRRWDYGVGVKKTESADRAIWIEVHPATAREVQPMLEKAKWLKGWLQNRAPDLMVLTDGDSPYIWIASGGVSLQRSSPQARNLALAGITFPKEYYRIQTG
jgi:hypothetical protein